MGLLGVRKCSLDLDGGYAQGMHVVCGDVNQTAHLGCSTFLYIILHLNKNEHLRTTRLTSYRCAILSTTFLPICFHSYPASGNHKSAFFLYGFAFLGISY